MRENLLLFSIILINSLFLLYGISELSISYKETEIFFNGTGLLNFIVNLSCDIFGQNDFALRIPFVLIHIASVFLIYKIGKSFLKRRVDRVTSVLVYVMLPGVSASAILINEASLVIFLTLLFIWFFQEGLIYRAYSILFISLFVDNSFSFLYLSLFFYGIFKKDSKLFIFTLLLFGASMYMYGFDVHGKPRGYFMDTFGVYVATFSPLVFLYYIYTMYRITIKEEKNLLWYISFGVFAFAFILSFRQKLKLEDFLPFAVIATPLMIRVFFNSFRVRLPMHRRWHSSLLMVVIFSLSLSFVMSVFNKPIYYLVKSPNKHFVYKYHVAKELSEWLKSKDIQAIHVENKKLATRLEFYGISNSSKIFLKTSDFTEIDDEDFILKYSGYNIAHFKILVQ